MRFWRTDTDDEPDDPITREQNRLLAETMRLERRKNVLQMRENNITLACQVTELEQRAIARGEELP